MNSEHHFAAFISYASKDLEKAQAVCTRLEQLGHACWIAPRNVRPGQSYGEEIIRGIEQSRNVVLILSSAANESEFVLREVERAVSKRKPVFPVRIESVLPSPGIEFFVSASHWLDAWSGDLNEHADRLAQSLGPANPAAVASAPPAPARKVRRDWQTISMAALAGGILIVTAVLFGKDLLVAEAPDPAVAASLAEMRERDRLNDALDEMFLQRSSGSKAFDEGLRLAAARRPRDAVAKFEEALRLDPAHHRASLELGNALMAERRLHEAIVQFHSTLRIRDSAIARVTLADALLVAERAAEAIDHLEKALGLAPYDSAIREKFEKTKALAGRNTASAHPDSKR